MSSLRHRNHFSILRTLAGVAAVGITTFVVFQLHLNFAAAGFLQLLLVMVIAVEAGFWEATVASLVANLFLDLFFVPPLFHFEVNDAQNWIALIAFECSALIVSRLATSARHQRSRAFHNRSEIRHLSKASRQLSLLNLEGSGSAEIARLIKRTFLADSVVFFNGVTDVTNSAGKGDQQLIAETRGAYQLKENIASSTPRTHIRVLLFGTQSVGALGIQGVTMSAVTADALATLVAAALERSHTPLPPYSLNSERRLRT